MSRNSRPWQDQRHHVKIIEGDINEGNRWYATAVVRLKFLLSNQPGSVTDVMQPTSDVTIRVDTRPNRIHIKVKGGGIYMESGFIDLIATGKCTEASYRPGTLNYNAKVTALLGPSDTPVQGKVKLEDTDLAESPFTGENLLNGSTSLATGCSKSSMVAEVVTPDPCGITYGNGGYCGIGLQLRKDCMQKVSSSNYTGKLRLFVQAIYGSTRSDFVKNGSTIALQDQSGQIYSNPKDGVIGLGYSGVNQSMWLYTIGNGGYALCYLLYPNIIMIPLLLDEAATKFAKTLAAHPNKSDFVFATKVEAYILAYAKPVYDSTLWLRIPVTGPLPAGDPLSYGWHSNWAGDEAHIVTFYSDPVNNRYISNQYKLKINQSVDSAGHISFSVAITNVEADKPWVNWGTFLPLHVFYYDEVTQQMIALAKPTFTPPAPFSHDAPIYCFTRLNVVAGDCELVVARAYRSIFTSANESSNGPTRVTSLTSFYQFIRRSYTGDQGDSGFKLAGAINVSYVEGNRSMIYNNTIENVFNGMGSLQGTSGGSWDNNTNWATDNGWEAVSANIWRKASGPGWVYARMLTQTAIFTKIERNRDLETVTLSAFFEVPINCCDAVIVGTSKQTSNSGGSTRTRVGWWYWDDILYAASGPESGYVVNGGPIISFSSTGGSLYVRGYSSPFSTNFNVTTSDTGLVTTPAELLYDTKINEVVSTEDPSVVFTSTSNGDTRYFAPTLSNPGTGSIDAVRSSLQSGAVSNHTLYDKDYGFIKDASVGWA